MGFERKCLAHVKKMVHKRHDQHIEPWFQSGTMFKSKSSIRCDKISDDVADTVHHSIINFIQAYKVIEGFNFRDYSVSKSVLRATEKEPWDQWCFDM
jgi:hypothetical protein|tara:strand:+ start:20096 stop:20386 length:291 start_codon:yes stop_codon:yes gene_type:complete